jgi:DNA primase
VGLSQPQLEDRNILIRYKHGGQKIVRRHPPGSAGYQTVKDVDDLSEIVREHGVEVWNETAKKGDLNRGDTAVLDIDNMRSAPEAKVKDVTKSVYRHMGKTFGKTPYIINTHGGYHVGVKLDSPMPYKTMRNKTETGVIGPLEEEFDGLVSGHNGKSPIFLDRTPMKLHGSSKAIGSLNMPDLTITEKIPLGDLDSFRRHKLT